MSVFTAGIFKETLKRLGIYSNVFGSARSFIAYVLKGKSAEVRRKRIGPSAIASGASELCVRCYTRHRGATCCDDGESVVATTTQCSVEQRV